MIELKQTKNSRVKIERFILFLFSTEMFFSFCVQLVLVVVSFVRVIDVPSGKVKAIGCHPMIFQTIGINNSETISQIIQIVQQGWSCKLICQVPLRSTHYTLRRTVAKSTLKKSQNASTKSTSQQTMQNCGNFSDQLDQYFEKRYRVDFFRPRIH